MGWVDALHGKTIVIDTAPLIYFIMRDQEQDRYTKMTRLFEAIASNSVHAICSTLVLTEVLIRPIRQNRPDLVATYEDILTHPDHSITLIRVSEQIAKQAAELRVKYSLKTPDAIHLATALSYPADVFMTNDDDFPIDSGIEVLLVDQLSL